MDAAHSVRLPIRHQNTYFIYFCWVSGPGLRPADERTLQYVREVAINTARGLADGSVKKQPRKKNMMDKVQSLLLC